MGRPGACGKLPSLSTSSGGRSLNRSLSGAFRTAPGEGTGLSRRPDFPGPTLSPAASFLGGYSVSLSFVLSRIFLYKLKILLYNQMKHSSLIAHIHDLVSLHSTYTAYTCLNLGETIFDLRLSLRKERELLYFGNLSSLSH